MENVQDRFRTSSTGLLTWALKLFSGLLLGLTLSLIGQEMIGYGNLSFTLVIVTITGVFLRISRNWRLVGVLIFDLICVLIAMLLRMYILIAPGA